MDLAACDICSNFGPFLDYTSCPNSDLICYNCIREVIKDTTDNKKPGLFCPKTSCEANIKLDCLTKKIDQITVEMLSRKIEKWLDKSHNESLEKLFLKFSCTHCNFQTLMDRDETHFICHNCRLELCSYCLQPWSLCVNHKECKILNYSGQKCFLESQVLPDNWDKKEPIVTEDNDAIIDVELKSDVNLLSSEAKTIIKFFSKTLHGKKVTAITRIQNIKSWEKYVLKRKHMIDEIGLSNIKERTLFHGTDASNISLICNEGFDMRVKTVNGDSYGKGNYFSTHSHYSKRYAGTSNQMFLAKVLCGLSTRGSKEMTRPPKDQVTDRMYDSCVNDIHNPTIYVLFDNAQCYPAYIITYL